PPTSQRCHWNANERAPPVHVPGDAVSSSPTCAVPVMLGFAVFTGSFRDETRSVGFEPAVDWPSALDAVTITRSVWSEAAATGVYVLLCAPVISAQPVPLSLHRCHWYANFVGLLSHVPLSAVSVWPSPALPEIVGDAVFRGTAALAPPATSRAVATASEN